MRRVLLACFSILLLMVALVTVGCKDNIPQSELDRFIDWSRQVETSALEDTLKIIGESESEHAIHADYVLGNYYYEKASAKAAESGWNEPPVPALLEEAQVYLERAVERDSTFIEALVNLGSLWDDRSQQMSARKTRVEREETAKMYYNMALTLVPEDEKARCNLGSLYMRKRDPSHAIAEFKTVLEYNPKSALAHYNLAIMFAEAKIYREAISEWKLAAKYDTVGDIAERSKANIDIVGELMKAETPKNIQ